MLLLTVLSSVPVAQAIEELTGLEAKLKWPNDIEIDGKKVAGILVESASKGGNIGVPGPGHRHQPQHRPA